MISFNIKGDKKSPAISCEPYSGLFKIEGRSNLENPTSFYEPFLNWLKKYVQDPAIKTTLNVELEYFNSASAKLLMKAFRILEPLHNQKNRTVIIQWCSHDSDGSMKEAGEDFDSMLKVKFEYITIKD